MTALARTEGDWFVCPPDLAADYVGKQIVAFVHRPGCADILVLAPGDVASTEAEGNAAMSAASSEMHAALQAAEHWLVEEEAGNPALTPPQEILRVIRAAIAKAEGRADG